MKKGILLAIILPALAFLSFAYLVSAATLGYNKIGATTSNGSNRIRCVAVIPAVAASITSISIYGANDVGDHGVGALYSSTSTLLATTTDLGGGLTLGWHTANLNTPQSVTPGTTYYACGQFDLDAGGGYNDYYFDQNGIGLGAHGNASNYPLFEVPLVPDYGVEYSIYVSYACDPAVTSCTDVFENVGYSSWTAPTGVTSADVACWGPGGGGGVISATGGAGGGGGAFASSTVVVTPGNSYTIFVGTGGAADNAASTSNSSFATTTVSADGGKGASATVDTTFGHGGYVSGSIGTLVYAGGDGGTGLTTDDSGGGGGGAGGPHGAGGVGSNASATLGGDGGAGDAGSGGAGGLHVSGGAGSAGGEHYNGGGGGAGGDNTFSGGNGTIYGGGGGGGEAGGGIGGNGKCQVTYQAAAAAVVSAASTGVVIIFE